MEVSLQIEVDETIALGRGLVSGFASSAEVAAWTVFFLARIPASSR